MIFNLNYILTFYLEKIYLNNIKYFIQIIFKQKKHFRSVHYFVLDQRLHNIKISSELSVEVKSCHHPLINCQLIII